MQKFKMDSILHLHVLVFVCIILACETNAWDENSLSRPVITRNYRRLKGFTFNIFHSASLVSCGLQCQRNPRCVSTNFRKVSSLYKTKGICELNEKGTLSSIEDKELERDEEPVYTQFYDMKHDCQLSGCSNGRSCTFVEDSKAFNCKCKDLCCGVSPVPVGMESGAILNSQISASTEHYVNHDAYLARLHLKAVGGKTGGWAAGGNDMNQWLQVDLQQTTRVTGVATQGRDDADQWVTGYKLQHSEDGHTFTFYRRVGDYSDTIFQGNTDRNSVRYHELNPIIEARYIQVRPNGWIGHISMRMELYKC